MSGVKAPAGCTDFRGFARLLGEGDEYHVADLADAGRLVLSDDGRWVVVEASLQKLRDSVEPALPVRRTATFKDFARILGDCSPSYVTELKSAGRLVLTRDGKRVLVDESLQLIRDTADPARAGVAARHAAARGALAGEPAAAVDRDGGEAVLVDMTDPHARRRAKALADKEEALARKALREEQIELGQLLRTDEVRDALADAAVELRTGLENLRDILAPQLAAEPDADRVRVMLGDAVEQMLAELARKFAAIGRTEA